MAKEPDAVEDLPEPKVPGGGTSGGKSGLIPAFITIAAIPIVMGLMWQFYMLPSLKKLAAEPAAGEGAGEVALAEAAPKAAESEESSHGKGEKETEAQSYELKDVVANLSGAMRSRYIKVSFVLEGSAGNFHEMMAANEVKLRDASLAVLSDLTIQDLEEPGVKNIVRNSLITSINQTLHSSAVEELYFSEFVVQ